jgi:hypothetical protein
MCNDVAPPAGRPMRADGGRLRRRSLARRSSGCAGLRSPRPPAAAQPGGPGDDGHGERRRRPERRARRCGRASGAGTARRGQHGLGGAHFTAIAAFSEALLAYFDWRDEELPRHPGA